MPKTIDFSELNEMPPLPISVARLAQSVSVPEPSLEEITQIIEYDPVLTGNVLRWANSTWSHSQTTISSVWNAVVRLGSEVILKLAIGQQVKSAMRTECGGYGLIENALWKHGVTSALAAEALNRTTTRVIPPAAFATALMHDIGKIFLGRYFGQEEYQTCVENTGALDDTALLLAERKLTGTDHAEVGAQIARQWKLSEEMVRAIAQHHTPAVEATVLCDAVYFSNMIARLLGKTAGTEPKNLGIQSQVIQRLGLSTTHIQTISSLVEVEYQVTADKWEVN